MAMNRECEITEVEKCVEVEEEKCQEVIVIIFIKIFGKPSSSKLESKCITNVIPGGRGGAGLQDGRARAVSDHCRGTVPAGGQSCSQKKEMEILQNKTQLSKF